MKPKLLFFIIFSIINFIGCVNQKNAQNARYPLIKKKGIVLFAPKLNASYFFPFKDTSIASSFGDFVDCEYEPGFIIYWPNAKWRNSILDDFSSPIPNDSIYKHVALVSIEYYSLPANSSDSLYSLEFEYSGIKMNLQYDDKDLTIKNIEGLKQ
jgi:hypothetical protein